jgi:hypothetical protein
VYGAKFCYLNANRPERTIGKILEYADWMGIPIIPHDVSLDRFKELLSRCAA